MRASLIGRGLAACLAVSHGANAVIHGAHDAKLHDQNEAIVPNAASAEKNAHEIFNQLNNAGRQWGSSVKHNGVGFFPAVVPAGTLMYHGTRRQQPPEGLEWLAFEIEHAEAFGSSWLGGPGQPSKGQQVQAEAGEGQKQLRPQPRTTEAHTDSGNMRGYVHTYQATRDLRILYLDGMAAAKTNMGTLDTQDLVLCEDKVNTTKDHFMGETIRTEMICDMLKDVDYDGYVRLEIGFEIVYCDFNKGVELLSARRTFFTEDKAGDDGLQLFQWTRAVAERYNGLGVDRFKIDFSSIVSGWFFPINVTNTSSDRSDLKRLASAKQADLNVVKSHVLRSLTQPPRFTIDWQATTDEIVHRYANRLAHMVSPNISQISFINEIETAVLTFVEAPQLPGDVNILSDANESAETIREEEVQRCKEHFLLSPRKYKQSWKLEDELIHTALVAVMEDVCNVLLSVRSKLITVAPQKGSYGLRIDRRGSSNELDEAVGWGRDQVKHLVQRLDWAEWRKIRRCEVDEVMFIPMWPVGKINDFFHPGCRKTDFFGSVFEHDSYWDEYNL